MAKVFEKEKESLPKLICPMTLSNSSGPYECYKERCAWWVSNTRKNECGECAIMSLQDIA